MRRFVPTSGVCAVIVAVLGGAASADSSPRAADIVRAVLEGDPWGLGGASVAAHATLTDKRGAKSELAFVAKSRRYEPLLSKSIVRFSSPPDLAGAGFLQIQKPDGDDDRYLFLPDLKRSRRISGNLRGNAFMGTDFSFADLDRHDLRDSESQLVGDEPVGKWPCYVVDVRPKRSDAQYSHVSMWIRKDNNLPLREKMFDKAGVLSKTLEALEVKRVSGHWFVSRSRMQDNQHDHVTELVLDDIDAATEISDDEFTVRALEKP
jgi:Outer membrane lipoprotein-sorting protein